MIDKQAIIEKMAEIAYNHKVSDGYDRNGSHDAGEYVEYEWSLSDVIREEDMWKVEAVIEAALDASGLWKESNPIIPEHFASYQTDTLLILAGLLSYLVHACF